MAEALRIALLTHSVNPRGGVVHTLELARALHEAGHRPTVFAPAAKGQRLFRDVPFAVEPVEVPAASADVAAMVETRIAAFEAHLAGRGTAFDVWHAQDPIGANALADLQARGRAGGFLGGFVRTVHHLDDFADPRLAAWQRRGVTAASRVFCVGRLWCEVLRRDLGVEAALVPNGVDLDRFDRTPQPGDAALCERLGVRADATVVLAVGGIEARKNTVRVLQAFALLRRRLPAPQLVVAGGASLLDHDACAAAFRHEAAAAGLAVGPNGPVVVTGPLPDVAMPALLRRADVLAMASLREGFGLVVLEALASGTPVVASAIAPFTEYLGDTDCCWADPTDAASIADALQRALAPERAAALARETPAVCRRFSWAASAARHLKLYRRHLAAASQITADPAPAAADPAPNFLREGLVPCP